MRTPAALDLQNTMNEPATDVVMELISVLALLRVAVAPVMQEEALAPMDI